MRRRPRRSSGRPPFGVRRRRRPFDMPEDYADGSDDFDDWMTGQPAGKGETDAQG